MTSLRTEYLLLVFPFVMLLVEGLLPDDPDDE